MYVTFHCLYDNSENIAISSNFLWTLLGLLGSMNLHLGSVALPQKSCDGILFMLDIIKY